MPDARILTDIHIYDSNPLKFPLQARFGWVVVGRQEKYDLMPLVHKFDRQRESSYPCSSFWLPSKTTHKCDAHTAICSHSSCVPPQRLLAPAEFGQTIRPALSPTPATNTVPPP